MQEKFSVDIATQVTKLAEITIKKAWSIIDAASEKKPPSEYLSSKAIGAIQGKTNIEA